MNCFKLAFSNFKRNAESYFLYIFAMIFSVVVYYNFASIKYNPQLIKVQSINQYVKPLAEVAIVIFVLFLLFFIWFSNSLFLKQRKREIGIYAFMGVDNSNIGKMFAAEILITGITSLLSGLLIGILLSKLFMMILSKISLLNVVIKFYISYKAIFETACVFLIIYILISLKGYIDIVKSKLIDLFNASKREEELPKINYVKGILSIIIVGAGYYFALNAFSKPDNFTIYIFLAVICIVLGTYWLLGSFYPMVIRHFINKKKVLYKGVNIVSLSNIAFRIKNNYKALASIAILITCAVTAFGTAYSLRYYVENEASLQKPYTFSYISFPQDKKSENEVRNVLKGENEKILLNEKAKFILIDKFKTDAKYKFQSNEIAAVKLSDFNKISRDLNVDSLNKILKEAEVKKGEADYIDYSKVIITAGNIFGQHAFINNHKLNVKGNIKTPLFGLGVPTIGTLVLNDEDYNLLKKDFKEYEFDGIKIEDQKDMKKVSNITVKLNKIEGINKTLYSPYVKKVENSNIPLVGLVYFFGAFLSLVFIIATGSILSFKFLSEAYMDSDKYKMLSKIGMTKHEINKSVSRQIGISYAIPLLIGVIHSFVAIRLLSKMLKYNIVFPAVMSALMFTLIYLIFFIFTSRKICRIIK